MKAILMLLFFISSLLSYLLVTQGEPIVGLIKCFSDGVLADINGGMNER